MVKKTKTVTKHPEINFFFPLHRADGTDYPGPTHKASIHMFLVYTLFLRFTLLMNGV